MALLVNLCWIDRSSEHQRCIHGPSPRLREEGTGEIDQTVEKEHDTVLVPITLPSEYPIRTYRMLLFNCQAINPVFGSGDEIASLDMVSDHVHPYHDRDRIALLQLICPDLPQITEIPYQHRMVWSYRNNTSLGCLKTDKVRRTFMN